MKLIIVSWRLPFTVSVRKGKVSVQESPGGLVTALNALMPHLSSIVENIEEYVWVGWPGAALADVPHEELQRVMRHARYRIVPALFPEKTVNAFYHGFCNRTLWPLFHYFPSLMALSDEYWEAYREVNEEFARTIAALWAPGDLVWVHDFQLMLLPRLLRDRLPQSTIGFFLHIPFPSFEVFRLLPNVWRVSLLQGLLGADLIGFHTHDYAKYFLKSSLRLLGLEHELGVLHVEGREVKADTFPLGIDFHAFQSSRADPQVKEAAEALSPSLEGLKVILSVDRLDYTKGILNRLNGFVRFLEAHPEWRKRVVLLLVAVPSRVKVDHYQRMKREIDELVGSINGKYGTVRWTPIRYQYAQLPFPALAALYHLSDVALVTPLRDGMNLVAKEYIACHAERGGVLILSEMTGAAKELGEALIVNPFHDSEIAEALDAALRMPQEEQVRRNRAMARRLAGYDVAKWGKDYFSALTKPAQGSGRTACAAFTKEARQKLSAAFRAARASLLLLDYDGTLAPLQATPPEAAPSGALIALLRRLTGLPQVTLVLVSGRDRATMERWFGAVGAGLVAEHGVWARAGGGAWEMPHAASNAWKEKLKPLLEEYASRLPESFVEEKEFSLAWHYRKADPELGATRAKELTDDLVNYIANEDIQVFSGKKVVELRHKGFDKGAAAQRWLSSHPWDFVLAAGDDETDEDLFAALPPSAYSIKVGAGQTRARAALASPEELISLLTQLL